jgi:hypothetical protein
MALSAEKARLRIGQPISVGVAPVAAATTIFKGALISVVAGGAAGYAINAATATTHLVLGVATETVVNAGAAGAKSVPYEAGDFEFTSAGAADTIDQGDTGATVYVVDNDVVALTDGSSSRSVAGLVVGMNGAKPIVRVGLGLKS